VGGELAMFHSKEVASSFVLSLSYVLREVSGAQRQPPFSGYEHMGSAYLSKIVAIILKFMGILASSFPRDLDCSRS